MGAMLGVLITLVFSIGAACFGHLLIRRITPSLDPALRVGLCGLVGLGAIGTLTLFIGLAPGGLSTGGTWIVVLVCTAATALCARSLKYRVPFALARGPELIVAAAIGIALLFALVSILAPTDTIEWDTLAYHLAVPKIWLQAGQIQPVSFIHHSNFPFAVDNLYIWGLSWGGEAGAKAFTLAFHIFGIFAVFGFARQVYGGRAGWWAALTWTTIPVVLWLSGTAYIDVQNGLYAGLGILFAALFVKEREPHLAWMAGIMLGLAAGSKYTGLQTIFAVGVVLVAALFLGRRSNGAATPLPAKYILVVCGLALAVASPWYLKNIAWTGNPVYPFFYNQLGGKNWSKWNAQIYQAEQQSFGTGRELGDTTGPLQPQRIGQAILGIAYEPGRYINPGQTSGQGFPIGSIGFIVVGSMLLWLISGRASPFESSVLGAVLISFAMWFVLSEQSRYIIALGVPLSVLAGGGVLRLRAGPVLAVAIALQALFSFYLMKSFSANGRESRFDEQLRVVTGQTPLDEYKIHAASFLQPAEYLNQVAKGGRVALYDEVFGFLLDVPYFWANPGHTTELGYESMRTGEDLARSLRAKGITYVYLNRLPPGTNPRDPDFIRWDATLGLLGSPKPYTAEEWSQHGQDLNWRAKAVLGDAIATGWLAVDNQLGSQHFIFKVQDHPTPPSKRR
jgi:hypothetical protein